VKAIRPTSIDEYISSFPEEIQKPLRLMRDTIKNEAPQASEKISYRMPTFYLNGNLVHFAAFKKHIGLYPGASGVAAFEGELGAYEHSKGAIRFPLDQALPLALIRRIVRFRVAENTGRD
jgi:uncharacterized protein YdhG (YjbR/CyaY superfamily)